MASLLLEQVLAQTTELDHVRQHLETKYFVIIIFNKYSVEKKRGERVYLLYTNNKMVIIMHRK